MTSHKMPPKLPAQQLLILALERLAEPIALTSVFPYLPEMIESFGIDKANVSKWAGLTSAVFSLSQATTGVLWGRASDTFGRKPVILIGTTGCLISALLFGFSKTLGWAMLTRALAGAVNGNVGTIRTTVAEMVPEKELQPRAFSVMPTVWTVGTIFGPLIGGALAKPATRYPDIFGSMTFFTTFPFALPNFVAAFLAFLGIMIGFLFLKETTARKRDRHDPGIALGRSLTGCFKRNNQPNVTKEERAPLLANSSQADSANGDFVEENVNSIQGQSRPKVSWNEVFNRQSCLNLLVYGLLAMHSIAFDQLLPIFLHYPEQTDRSTNSDVKLPFKFTGGFGINSDRIGLLQTSYAIVTCVIQFVVFPPLARRWGILPSLKQVTCIFPIAYLLIPFTALVPQSPTILRYAVLYIPLLLKAYAVVFAFPCSTILLTNSAPSLLVLGTLNGVAVSISATGRAIGPAVVGWAFTVGVQSGYGILPWCVMALFAVGAAVPVWWLTEGQTFGERDQENEEQVDGADEVEQGLQSNGSVPANRVKSHDRGGNEGGG